MYDELFSDCCSASPRNGSDDYGICPECKDHCEYVGTDDDEDDGPYAQPAMPSLRDAIGVIGVVLSFIAFGGLLVVVGGVR